MEKVLTAAGLIDAGKVSPGPGSGSPEPAGARPRDPRLVRAPAHQADDGRGDRPLLQHRHRAGRHPVHPGAAVALPRHVRPRSRTDVGMPGETRGLLPPAADWSTLTRAQIAFGQGVSVSALQMAGGLNTIANDGEFVSPSLVEGRTTTAGSTRSAPRRPPAPGGQPDGRPQDRPDDGAGHHPGRRHRARGRHRGLPRGRQDRYRPAGRRRVQVLRTAASRSPSAASPRPTTRASPSTW